MVVRKALSVDAGSAWAWSRSGWIDVYKGDAEFGDRTVQDRARPCTARFSRIQQSGGDRLCAYSRRAVIPRPARWQERALIEHPSAIWIHRTLCPAYLLGGAEAEARRSVTALREQYPELTVADVQQAPATVCRRALLRSCCRLSAHCWPPALAVQLRRQCQASCRSATSRQAARRSISAASLAAFWAVRLSSIFVTQCRAVAARSTQFFCCGHVFRLHVDQASIEGAPDLRASCSDQQPEARSEQQHIHRQREGPIGQTPEDRKAEPCDRAARPEQLEWSNSRDRHPYAMTLSWISKSARICIIRING